MPAHAGQAKPDCIAFIVPVTAEDRINNELSFKTNPNIESNSTYRIKCSYETKVYDIQIMMRESGLCGFISPLHYPEGEDIQYHFHVMIVRPVRQGFSFKTWRYIAGSLGGLNDYIISLNRPHDYSKYLVHGRAKDKDKIQYCKSDVIAIGLDYEIYQSITDSRADIECDSNEILKAIISFIRTNHVIFFSDLLNISLESFPDWLTVIKSNRALIIDYMRSQEYASKQRLRLDNKRV